MGRARACRSRRRLTWGDVNEPRGRWRVAAAASRTGRPRPIELPHVLYEAVLQLCPRDDRHPDRCVFEEVTAERLRMALARAGTAAGVPSFSPHDLRHPPRLAAALAGRASAWISALVDHGDLVTTRHGRTHVLVDERELDRARLAQG